jgi:biopolymer transport protein ExbD
MLKVPSSRKRKKPDEKLNLVPIMDSVFIFIFFLLMSAQFLKIYEIGSDVPIVSENEPPKVDKDPLALNLKIEEKSLTLTRGLTPKVVLKLEKDTEGKYDLDKLHQTLVQLKKENIDEETIIFEPIADVEYQEMVIIMDQVRMFLRTDEAVFKKGKDGLDEKVKTLFSKILFSNLMS